MDVCVELCGVGQRYASTVALEAIELRITAGERVALVGPSGAGKSTLLNLINTTLRPTLGTVRVLGSDPALLDRRALRALQRRIATMHQGLHLAGELRVIHNVNAGKLGEWSASKAMWSLVRPQGAKDARIALDRFGLGRSSGSSRTETTSAGAEPIRGRPRRRRPRPLAVRGVGGGKAFTEQCFAPIQRWVRRTDRRCSTRNRRKPLSRSARG